MGVYQKEIQQMNATEKYLFQRRIDWVRDTEALSGADLDAMLGATDPVVDPSKRNPTPLTATGLVELLGSIIERSNRRLAAVAVVFDLNLERLQQTAEAAEQDGMVDRLTANMIALEREFSRRGPTVRRFTKWILQNAEHLRRLIVEKGRAQAMAEAVGYFEGVNAIGKCNSEYAAAVRQYFDIEREMGDTECNLMACCILLGLDYESIVERAAILEHDAGMPRTTATMRAIWYALQERRPGISEYMAGCIFDFAAPMLEQEQKNGWSRTETIDAVLACAGGWESKIVRMREAG